ncbi:unnamed protein product [Rotaria sp. Silwood2]|nr:unnamed protein product [Rotaria sp. Silwood2]
MIIPPLSLAERQFNGPTSEPRSVTCVLVELTGAPNNCSTPASSTTNAPSTPINSSWNGSAANTNNYSSSTTNPGIAEKKQEPHTPPVTSQQTIITAS